jgi:integrase
MSLAGARTAAIELKEGRTSGTVAALAEVYLKAGQGKRSAPEIERRLRKDVLPIIGHIPLPDLHRRDVTRVLDAKLASAPIVARRVFEDIRAMIRFAVGRGDLDHSPLDGLQAPPASKPRTRVLGENEIRVLWSFCLAAEGCSDERISIGFSADVARAIKLCLVTAQRLGEVTGITAGELDFDRKVWNIPGSRTKNGHPHSVPLSPMALDIIGPIGPSTKNVSNAIYEAQSRIGLDQWTAHDLRRSALTHMAQLGVSPIILGHIANHRTTTKAGITLGVYVHHQYEREKREALELWANRLQHITT